MSFELLLSIIDASAFDLASSSYFSLFRSVGVIVGHEINLAPQFERVGVTNVAGLRTPICGAGSYLLF